MHGFRTFNSQKTCNGSPTSALSYTADTKAIDGVFLPPYTPLRTTITAAAPLQPQITDPAFFSTRGVYRVRLLVVCAQALFACISLHNGRLNKPNSLHISRSSKKSFYPQVQSLRVLIYVLYCAVLSLLCLETMFLMNNHSLNMHTATLKGKMITKKVNHIGTPFEIRIMSGSIPYVSGYWYYMG